MISLLRKLGALTAIVGALGAIQGPSTAFAGPYPQPVQMDAPNLPGAVPRLTRDHLADTVNVRDFGAKCDGTTDDSGAIQAAINAAVGAGKGAAVLIPESAVCIVSSGLTATLNQNAGLNIRAGGKHGASLEYPAGFSGTGLTVSLQAPDHGAYIAMSGVTMLHDGTDTAGTAIKITEVSGVQDPSVNLSHLTFTSRTGGSWAKGVDMHEMNVTYLADITCFSFAGTCVSYDSSGALSVEHHLLDLYVNASSTSAIGVSIGHAGMTAPLQGFTISNPSCTGGGTCIVAQGAPHAIDELIVQGAQIASTNAGLDLTNVDSLVVSNNYFLEPHNPIMMEGGIRTAISNNVFMQGSATDVPITLSNVGSGGAGGGTISSNVFTNNVSQSPIVLKNGTNYIYVTGNNCFEVASCVDTSGLSAGFTSNVIGVNDENQMNTVHTLAFPVPSGNPLQLRGTGDKQMTLDWLGATYGLTVTVDGSGNVALDAGEAPGQISLKPNVDVSGLLSVGSGITERTPSTPTSSSATCTVGQHAWDTSYEYRCVATNTWKRAALATW